MYDLSQLLDVPVSFFYDDMSEEVKDRNAVDGSGVVDEVEVEKDQLTRRETLGLVRAYYKGAILLSEKRSSSWLNPLRGLRLNKRASPYRR